MSAPDYNVELDEEDGAWYVFNITKWGRKDLARFNGPGAEEWARKYYVWLVEREKDERLMGYYIGCGRNKEKAAYLIENHGAERLPAVHFDTFKNLPADKTIVCIIDNGPFEAAAVCYSQRELDKFALDQTGRQKEFLLIDKAVAYELSGYKEKA